MKNIFSKTKILAVIIPLLFLSGCITNWESDPITDINDLEGRKVGVNLSWEADYILTPRTDMELYRYDATSDMLMALDFDKIDAVAVDLLMWNLFAGCSTGLVKIEPEFATTGYTCYFSSDNEQLKDEFNAFLKEFKTTDTYKDFIEREYAFYGDEYNGPDIPLTGTGKVIRVAIDAGGFPRAFYDPGEDIPKGFDLEPLKHFANKYNYRLEFFSSNYDDEVLGLINGIYDVCTGYLSEVYRSEVISRGIFLSDPFDEVPLYFVQKTVQDIEVEMAALE